MELEFTGERLVPDKFSEYDEIFIEHFTRYIFAKNYVKDKNVLDAGCGCGYGLNLLTPHISKGVGIDISEEAIKYSYENFKNPKTNYIVMNCSQLIFPNDYFDAIISFELIEHIEDQDSFLKGIARVMTKEGLFIVSTPNKINYSMAGKNPFHIHEMELNEFTSKLKKYFRKVDMWGQGLDQKFIENKPITDLKKEVEWIKHQMDNLPATLLKSIIKGILPSFFKKKLRLRNLKHKLTNLNENSLMEKVVISPNDLDKALYFIGICTGKH